MGPSARLDRLVLMGLGPDVQQASSSRSVALEESARALLTLPLAFARAVVAPFPAVAPAAAAATSSPAPTLPLRIRSPTVLIPGPTCRPWWRTAPSTQLGWPNSVRFYRTTSAAPSSPYCPADPVPSSHTESDPSNPVSTQLPPSRLFVSIHSVRVYCSLHWDLNEHSMHVIRLRIE
jgi:hypothetical protein